MRFSRHLQRLRARWRLHRMEWAAMHRPLQPPPGYEKYHTMEAVFPGLRHKTKKTKTFADFRIAMYRAWRLYKHNFKPDPEMQKLEDDMKLETWSRRENSVKGLLKSGEKAASQGVDTVEKVASSATAAFQENRPFLEKTARDRIGVLRTAVSEFTEGYHESVSGERNFWGEASYDEDLVRDDNIPVRYEVEESTN